MEPRHADRHVPDDHPHRPSHGQAVDTLSDGTPVIDAYSPGARNEEPNEAHLPAILALLSSRFGPYPAPAAGGLFVDAAVGFSLETFTRPVYTAGVGVPTIVHENAHQWWGDNVSIASWKDICFNECMASYAQWLWSEHNGVNLDARYKATIDTVDFAAPLYDMGPGTSSTTQASTRRAPTSSTRFDARSVTTRRTSPPCRASSGSSAAGT